MLKEGLSPEVCTIQSSDRQDLERMFEVHRLAGSCGVAGPLHRHPNGIPTRQDSRRPERNVPHGDGSELEDPGRQLGEVPDPCPIETTPRENRNWVAPSSVVASHRDKTRRFCQRLRREWRRDRVVGLPSVSAIRVGG